MLEHPKASRTSILGDNREDETMGNQQERRLADLNWLAGIWEGEGSVGLGRSFKPMSMQYFPFATLVNTDRRLMSEAHRIMTEHGIPATVVIKKASGFGKKMKLLIQIMGMKRVDILLQLLAPYFRADKGEKAKCVLKFISHRRSLPRRRQKYGAFEDALWLELRKLNGYSLTESSETARRAVARRMIQSEPHTKDAEGDRNDRLAS